MTGGQARLRSDKIRVIGIVAAIASTHRMRVLAAGGAVFAALGLVSPRVLASAVFIVEPLQKRHLVLALEGQGWHQVSSRSAAALLPPIFVSLEHRDFACSIDLYDIFPGFYASPIAVFERLWMHRQTVVLGGITTLSVDRPTTIVLAAHEWLGAVAKHRRAPSHVVFIASLYRESLSVAEQADVIELIASVNGAEPLRWFLREIGVDVAPQVIPSALYTRARLSLDRVDDGVIFALAVLEAPRARRVATLLALARTHPATFVSAVVRLPRSAAVVAGSRRRYRAEHGLSRRAR